LGLLVGMEEFVRVVSVVMATVHGNTIEGVIGSIMMIRSIVG
jgi:hypothetical protein